MTNTLYITSQHNHAPYEPWLYTVHSDWNSLAIVIVSQSSGQDPSKDFYEPLLILILIADMILLFVSKFIYSY